MRAGGGNGGSSSSSPIWAAALGVDRERASSQSTNPSPNHKDEGSLRRSGAAEGTSSPASLRATNWSSKSPAGWRSLRNSFSGVRNSGGSSPLSPNVSSGSSPRRSVRGAPAQNKATELASELDDDFSMF